MTEEQKERYAAAMEILLNKIEDHIEGKIPDWLNENPYWEIDGDNGLPERCPRTTAADARESLTDDFIVQGDNIEPYMFDFFQFCIGEIYNVAMDKDNPYRAAYAKKAQKAAPVLTPYEQTVVRTNQLCANIFNDIMGANNEKHS